MSIDHTVDHTARTRTLAQESPVACDLFVLPPLTRTEHLTLARSLLFVADQYVTELHDGLAFELPASRFDEVARFVANERRCCAHLSFVIDVPSHGAAIALRITGAGVREGLSAIAAPPDSTPRAKEHA